MLSEAASRRAGEESKYSNLYDSRGQSMDLGATFQSVDLDADLGARSGTVSLHGYPDVG